MLQVDIAYIPINNGSDVDKHIKPERFCQALRGMPCIGGAISRDIKHSVIAHLDEVDELAAKIQSVNTVIVLPDGRLKGYNTDALGFRQAIANGTLKSTYQPRTAVCYGYGGVASVVVSVLQELGMEVCIIGRDQEIAKKRAKQLGIEAWSSAKSGQIDLFVNATPASDSPLDEAPFFEEALAGCKVAFDHEMKGQYLVEACAAQGIYHIKGLDMYYPQMYAQWKLFLDGIVEPETIPDLIAEAERDSMRPRIPDESEKVDSFFAF